jgi:hypothetical protein
MTPAEEYRQRAIEFFDLAAKSDNPEEREALRTFALCCLQLERAEEDRRQRASSQPGHDGADGGGSDGGMVC